MRSFGQKKYSRLAAAVLAALLLLTLSACKEEKGDWEDTLPSAVTTTQKGTAEVITEDTKPPISIEMPEKTSAAEKKTELATTLTPDEPEETSLRGSVSGVPDVPVSEFTSTSPITAPPLTDAPVSAATVSPAQSAPPDGTAEGSGAVTTDGIVEETSHVVTAADPDAPYVFNDPISRPYSYGSLSGAKRDLYDLVIKSIKEHDARITVPDNINVTSDDYCEVYQMIYNNEHSVFGIDTQMKYTSQARDKKLVAFELCYIYTEDEMKAMQEQIDEAADRIIAGITEDMSEYDIVKYFYDTIISSCDYDETPENCRDIYGCLVVKRAVCGGYAKAFSYLCDRVGIPSLTITGDSDEIPHMWNMVKLGNDWYHIDPTAGYVGNPDNKYIRYDYFCVNDEVINKTRTVYEQNFTYPKAAAVKYNYYVYNGLVAADFNDAERLIENCIIEASKTKRRDVQIACADDETFENVIYKLFDQSQAYALTIYENAYDKCKNKYNRAAITYNSDKATRVIKLFIDYTEE